MLTDHWQKSSYCAEGESCVHVTATSNAVKLTENSDPSGAILSATHLAWAALVDALKEESCG